MSFWEHLQSLRVQLHDYFPLYEVSVCRYDGRTLWPAKHWGGWRTEWLHTPKNVSNHCFITLITPLSQGLKQAKDAI